MNISAHRLEIANGGDDHLRRCEPNEQVDRGLIGRIAARDTQAMYELLSREEIAAAMRCPIDAVMMRMKSARRRMSALTWLPSTSNSGVDLQEATGDDASTAATLRGLQVVTCHNFI